MRELLVGCGNSRDKKFFINADPNWHDLTTLDIDPNCGADVLHDLNVIPLPFPDNSFDEIAAYETLEHVGRQGDWRFYFDQWADFHRIAKPGGLFFGTCPHHSSPWAFGDPSHTRIISIESLTFLSQKAYAQNIGRSNMTDFRRWYKADWELEYQKVSEDLTQYFILKAIK